MSVGRMLDRQLVPGMPGGAVQASAPGGSAAEVEVVEVDRLGVSVRGVRVRGAAAGTVEGQARRLPDALRGLPDRLVPLEVEPRLGGAILRSDPEDVHEREYFEVRTDGREATVERVRGGTGERLPFTLTREQLGHLVDRVSDAMPEPEPRTVRVERGPKRP